MIGGQDTNINEQNKTETSVRESQRVTTMLPQADDQYLKTKVAQVFGKDLADVSTYDLELGRILDWAKSKGASAPEDVMYQVRYLAARLGAPSFGEDPIKFVHQYIYLLTEKDNIDREIRKLEGIKNG
jgi:hypothetical protein